MGKHFGGRTKKTYSKYSVPETKEAFRQRIKRPCPKFEDLFIDKEITENIFDSPPTLKNPLIALTKPSLQSDISGSSFNSGNDTFDAIIKSELSNVQNKLKCAVKSPEVLFASATSSASSTDGPYLSAFQSPQNEGLFLSTPSKCGMGNKFSVYYRHVVREDKSNASINHTKNGVIEESKNLSTYSMFNALKNTPSISQDTPVVLKSMPAIFTTSPAVLTSTPAICDVRSRLKKIDIMKSEFSPVDKNLSFVVVEDSYISESDICLIDNNFKSDNATNVPNNNNNNLNFNNPQKNLSSESKNTDHSSDLVFSDEDLLGNTFSKVLSLKPTKFQRVTRRRKFTGNCITNNKDKFYYSSKMSMNNRSRLDSDKTNNLSNRNSFIPVNNKISICSNLNKNSTLSLCSNLDKNSKLFLCSNLDTNRNSNVSELSVSICKGGKGWRRSLKKLSNVIDSQSLESNFSGSSDFFGIKSFRTEILKLCEQDQELLITECFNECVMEKCKKIGEGLFGEVFLINLGDHSKTEVLKLMPIEGDLKVNGEVQKSFQQMIPEIIISRHLSDLRNEVSKNACPSFVKLNKCWCLMGAYSHEMIKLWDGYAASKGSDNDRPDSYPMEQLHLALQYEFAGQDLEAYVFNNGKQAYSVFLQIAYAMGVAELELYFEHRDLHWGNVLIRPTTETFLNYEVKGKPLRIKSYGVKATIIDFTLSRMSVDEKVYFNDLSKDPELFINEGDYQFTIYRKMQENNNDNWEEFQPKSNIFWLHYLLLKIKDHCYYKNTTSKIHKEGLKEVKVMVNSILDYDSALHLVCDLENIS